jgi:hypothetical protein
MWAGVRSAGREGVVKGFGRAALHAAGLMNDAHR